MSGSAGQGLAQLYPGAARMHLALTSPTALPASSAEPGAGRWGWSPVSRVTWRTCGACLIGAKVRGAVVKHARRRAELQEKARRWDIDTLATGEVERRWPPSLTKRCACPPRALGTGRRASMVGAA